MLCKDGYIWNSKEEGIEPLKIWDRDEVIALLDKMYQNGFRYVIPMDMILKRIH